jgi:hypothetical protein
MTDQSVAYFKNGTPKPLAPVKTASPQAPAKTGWFQPGQSGNPKGRRLHARDRLTKAFITSLADSFDKKGKKVIDKLADTDPASYARLCASLLPKEVMMKSGPLDHLSDEEITALTYAARRLAEADEA